MDASDTLQFPHAEDGGYVHWMGKGEPGHQEYVARMSSARNEKNRPNRISGYLFNASGGKGAGSYFEEKGTKGQWIHYVRVINAKATSGDFPNGCTMIYRDGTFEDKDDLNYHGTVIKTTHGKAPFRVGTRDLTSFFEGAVGKVATYDKELSGKRIKEHYRAMYKKQPRTQPQLDRLRPGRTVRSVARPHDGGGLPGPTATPDPLRTRGPGGPPVRRRPAAGWANQRPVLLPGGTAPEVRETL